MEEITRFLQIRQVQQLPEEHKIHTTLPVYHKSKGSEFAQKLLFSIDEEQYKNTIDKYKINFDGKRIITNPSQLIPTVKALYEFLDYKSFPLNYVDFEAQLKLLSPLKEQDLLEAWEIYADNLVIAIWENKIQYNHSIDFQLLIKTCYILQKCTTIKDNLVVAKGHQELLNTIIRMPLLIPAGIIFSRCRNGLAKTSNQVFSGCYC